MANTVLKVENIWKQYKLGLVNTQSIKDDLRRAWAKMRGKEDPTLKIGQKNDREMSASDYVWALQDVSFEVKQGEVLGIIGKNGAGKSTLLKILSKVTTPTKGQIKTKGRIASLLEVGTGFHPELTGRENIFLNGAILGMTRNDIRTRLDEIVAFSGIGNYIDTPVKRYSSGMYVRLAFAEVLAVGDAEFQKKCLGKMKDVSGEGRTVLFVSHDMRAIKTLCGRAIMLKNGKLFRLEAVNEVISIYLSDGVSYHKNTIFPIERDDIKIHNFTISQNGVYVDEFSSDYPIDLSVIIELKENLTFFRVGFFIKDYQGQLILRTLLADWQPEYENLTKGVYEVKTKISESTFTTGKYIVEVHTSRYGIKDYETDTITSTLISIASPTDFNNAHLGENTFGYLHTKEKFEIVKHENN
ncbi:MAG: ABC transporter ATP-binding protein [Cytophagales bacterium]|nr:MAG: ABC transporter ATP-binding protein [Cytophagales bacterium]